MTTMRRHFIKLAPGEPDQCAVCLQVWPCEVAQLHREVVRLQQGLRDLNRRVKEIIAGIDADDDDESATTNVIPIVMQMGEGDGR